MVSIAMLLSRVLGCTGVTEHVGCMALLHGAWRVHGDDCTVHGGGCKVHGHGGSYMAHDLNQFQLEAKHDGDGDEAEVHTHNYKHADAGRIPRVWSTAKRTFTNPQLP